jgi:UDP-2,3-diacylglucosamine hydrolase
MKKTYFASDFHLGVDARHSSKERERHIVRWLEQISPDAASIYLVGDIFDFWFEYGTVVPKGFTRLLGLLGRLRDAGLPIYYFTGNHDMWMFRYFEEELDIPTYREPIKVEIGDKKIFIGHGDGLGPGDKGYKFLKKVFSNTGCQWLFERIHPNLGMRIAQYWSGKSRLNQVPEPFLGAEREWLVQFSEAYLKEEDIDYFVFGHRHLALDYMLSNGWSRYINLGEWLHTYSYAVFDGEKMNIKYFLDENEMGSNKKY